MLDKDKANLEDCIYAISHIEEYTQNIFSADDLFADTKTYDAVLMNFVIIAEACKRMSEDIQQRNSDIPWQSIRGFRNYIAHDYFGLDIDMIWQSITIELPKLKAAFSETIINNQ